MDFRGRRPEKACVGSPRPRSNLPREINVCDEVSLETTFESFTLLLCIGKFVDAQLIEREPEDCARPTMWRFVRGTENGAVSLVPQDGEFHEACALIPVEPASAFVDHRQCPFLSTTCRADARNYCTKLGKSATCDKAQSPRSIEPAGSPIVVVPTRAIPDTDRTMPLRVRWGAKRKHCNYAPALHCSS